MLKSQYKRRNKNLKELGYNSYKEYLSSPLWQKIRTAVLKRDLNICQCCGGQATEVHHKRYTKTVLTGKNLARLNSICNTCHKNIEFIKNTKTSVGKANGLFNLLRKTNKVKSKMRTRKKT